MDRKLGERRSIRQINVDTMIGSGPSGPGVSCAGHTTQAKWCGPRTARNCLGRYPVVARRCLASYTPRPDRALQVGGGNVGLNLSVG